MTIEIADRLIKLRKNHGYSQEELADKLGLSRQAVSKWERAEASPDTDNLICLAKLYDVSLDELLSTDEESFEMEPHLKYNLETEIESILIEIYNKNFPCNEKNINSKEINLNILIKIILKLIKMN